MKMNNENKKLSRNRKRRTERRIKIENNMKLTINKIKYNENEELKSRQKILN